MRMLNSGEIGIIAGGSLPSCPPCPDDCPVGEEVTSTGSRYNWDLSSGGLGLWGRNRTLAFYYGGGGGSGGGGGGGEEQETPRDTPCVTDKPTKHANILDIHQGAIDLKAKMPEVHSIIPGEKWEYFGVVWKLPGGAVQTTKPVTSGHPTAVLAREVWEALDAIPDDAIILGIFHSQPDNGRMSDIDWNAYKLIFNNPGSPSMIARPGSFAISESIGRGITADPNGLSYVYDMKSGKIHVYDKSDMGSDKVQCHVNNSNGGG